MAGPSLPPKGLLCGSSLGPSLEASDGDTCGRRVGRGMGTESRNLSVLLSAVLGLLSVSIGIRLCPLGNFSCASSNEKKYETFVLYDLV